MTATIRAIGHKGKYVPALNVGRFRPLGRSIAAVMQAARDLWAHKPTAELAKITGVSQRQAERWLGGEKGISADALAALIRSEHGREFLVALMADANPEWWRVTQQAFRIGWMRRQKRELEEAIRAADSITDTIARAESALRFSEAHENRQAIDPVRPTARVANRAVAAKRRG